MSMPDPDSAGECAAVVCIGVAIRDAAVEERVRAALHRACDAHIIVADIEEADIVIADRAFTAGSPVLVIGSSAIIDHAMQHGAAGGLPPTFSDAQLRIAIEACAHGLACRPIRHDHDGAEPVQHALTVREIEVLDRLMSGASNKEIARQLAISVHTAKFHVAAIIAKLGASGRTDAVARAVRAGHGMI